MIFKFVPELVNHNKSLNNRQDPVGGGVLKEFIKGKRNKKDVQEFSFCLVDNILLLHTDLTNRNYRHGGYHAFNISDPKPRSIHKASVRDRLLHHAIYRVLYPFFDKTFIPDSFSCRKNKGTHKALNRFHEFGHKVSKNNTRTCWILKCDIRKFFANIDHQILLDILNSYIPDKQIIWLLKEIIQSFSTKPNTGLPLGNLTSQLFINIYMNEFDQFIKHKMKVKYYIRYADDFVILSDKQKELKNFIIPIRDFLFDKLKLDLHPQKVFIKTLALGVDFLGWVNFLNHRVLRTATKRRMIEKLIISQSRQSFQSYLGLLTHGNTHKLREIIMNIKT